MLYKFLAVALILHGAAALGHADDASKAAKAEEYFRLAKTEESMRQALKILADQVKSGIVQQVTGTKMPPGIEKDFAVFQDQVMAVVSDALSWDKVKPAFLQAVVDTYSEGELDGINAFLKTPAGQAMIDKQPALMTKGAAIGQERMTSVIPELQRLVKAFIAKATESGKK
jgi:hypothetical protein